MNYYLVLPLDVRKFWTQAASMSEPEVDTGNILKMAQMIS